MKKNNMRRISLLITAQTAWNLERLRKMAGYHDAGKVVDKLVREKMLMLKGRSEGAHEGKEKP